LVIKNANYITSCVERSFYPEPKLPEFIFFGRSNVGKSSLINALTNRKNLAYTSSKPGKTLTLNFYLINDSFYFIDAPGYGYAKKDIQTKLNFGKMIEDYLKNKDYLKYAFLVIDSKIGLTEDDCLMFNFLVDKGVVPIVIATKVDKLNQKETNLSLNKITKTFENTSFDVEVYFVSSVSKKGLLQVLDKIEDALN